MQKILITGGAGFIGTNYAVRLIESGHNITIFDNLYRAGASKNLRWLRERYGDGFQFVQGDVRDAEAVLMVVRGQDAVYHLAAQAAVTTSVENPREDFDINALGTFNVLEAARLNGRQPLVVYASTNKVYGEMENLRVRESESRWEYVDQPLGVSESQLLDFHSPYGCSKGAGDQYVRDYARMYALPTVVFRQSCIYGSRQFGIEDQGWLAHFVISTVKHRQIRIYGDGKQVRDLLWVDDLLDIYDLVLSSPEKAAGRVYNIGGGAGFTLSVWCELEPHLGRLANRKLEVQFGEPRPGDQKVYVSDIRSAERDLGWRPKVNPEEGLKRLWEWVTMNMDLFD